MNWGDGEDDAEDDGQEQRLGGWLHAESTNIAPTVTDLGRMKQLEIEFVQRISEEWPTLKPNEPDKR